MKRLLCIVGFVIAGCAAVSGVPTHSLAQRPAFPDNGGFNVNDSGNYSRSGCGPFGSGHLSFSGSGAGYFIYGEKESGSISSPRNSCTFSGAATMVNKGRPSNSITMALISSSLPCFHVYSTTMSFVITGGTGKFAKAKGNGSVVIECGPGNSGKYVDHWSGTIMF